MKGMLLWALASLSAFALIFSIIGLFNGAQILTGQEMGALIAFLVGAIFFAIKMGDE